MSDLSGLIPFAKPVPKSRPMPSETRAVVERVRCRPVPARVACSPCPSAPRTGTTPPRWRGRRTASCCWAAGAIAPTARLRTSSPCSSCPATSSPPCLARTASPSARWRPASATTARAAWSAGRRARAHRARHPVWLSERHQQRLRPAQAVALSQGNSTRHADGDARAPRPPSGANARWTARMSSPITGHPIDVEMALGPINPNGCGSSAPANRSFDADARLLDDFGPVANVGRKEVPQRFGGSTARDHAMG
jgi:hypothetical protein